MSFFAMIPRYLIALVLTISAYAIYGSLVAPRLEGESQIVESKPAFPIQHRPATDIKQDLTGLFPADGWEWEPCTMLETPQAIILFHDHSVLEDGSIELTPLSMVLHAKPQVVDGQAIEQPPLIMRAPSARLKFERSLAAGGDVGDLEYGQLIGRVQLYRLASGEGQDDDLYLETQNVKISPERISTIYDCQFRFGKSYGRGRHLTADLFGPNSENGATTKAFSGVERIELARMHELYLHREQKKATPAAAAEDPSKDGDLLGDTSGSFLITSNGPMKFDFHSKTVTFQDNVVVKPAEQVGDQLECQKLEVVLDEKKSADGQSHDLTVQRIFAAGTAASPATITSFTRNARIVAQGIDYDLPANQVALTSNDMVSLERDGQRIQSREIRYQFTEDGRIGNADMLGPGLLTQPATEEGKGEIVCHWQRQLRLQDDNGKKVLSLGRGKIEMDDTVVTADQMHFWIWEVPVPATNPQRKPGWRFEPAKFFARGQVTIQSPQLNGNCRETAAFWPQPAGANENALRLSPARQRYVVARPPIQQEQSSGNQQWQQAHQAQPPHQAQQASLTWRSPSTVRNPSWQQPQPVQQALHWQSNDSETYIALTSMETSQPQPRSIRFVGTQVQLQMHGGDRRTEVAEMTVDGDVVVQQQQRNPQGAIRTALEVRGEKLRILSQGTDRYRLFVSGKPGVPAQVLLEQLRLQGNLIHLDQTANRLWIQGPGELHAVESPSATPDVPSLRNAGAVAQPALLAAGNTTVTWHGGMVFDGEMLYFETDVRSQSRQTSSSDGSTTTSATRSAALSISLNQRLDFTELESDPPPEIQARRLVMVGQMNQGEVSFGDHWKPATKPRAWIAMVKFDRDGNPTTNQEIFAHRLTYDADSAAIQCSGRGTVIARQLAKAGSSGSGTPGQLVSAGGARKGNIDFIKVDYDESFRGNLNNNELQFTGNVHTFYTDISDWKLVPGEGAIQQPGSRGMIMDCDQLLLSQWTPQGSKPTIDMTATGNARIRGNQFHATAERISYYQANAQVVMDAPNRSNSEIWFNDAGSTNKGHLVARTITYNIDTGEYQVQVMKQVDYSQQGRSPNK